MPRTKAVKTKKKEEKKNGEDVAPETIEKMKKQARELMEKKQKDHEALVSKILDNFNLKYKMLMMEIGPYKKMTLNELRANVKGPTILQNFSAESIMEVTNSIRSVAKKGRRSLSCTEDEGYLTAESTDTKTGRRVSRARAKMALPKSTRLSRSLSRSKMQAVPRLNTYQTPSHQKAPQTFGMVTPKVKPNTPQVVLRRPKQGEVAISLQGSPLMVNSVVSDVMANINIPLNDGRMLSIQPQRGLRISQIPTLDPDTHRQIQALRDNLDKMCANAVVKKY